MGILEEWGEAYGELREAHVRHPLVRQADGMDAGQRTAGELRVWIQEQEAVMGLLEDMEVRIGRLEELGLVQFPDVKQGLTDVLTRQEAAQRQMQRIEEGGGPNAELYAHIAKVRTANTQTEMALQGEVSIRQVQYKELLSLIDTLRTQVAHIEEMMTAAKEEAQPELPAQTWWQRLVSGPG